MIIVTGGAGFIGSALVWRLNQRGRTDILIVDLIDHEEKKHNLEPLKYINVVGIDEFRNGIKVGEYDQKNVEAIFHLGACSSTTEQNWDFLADINVEYSKELITWSTAHNVRCVYASSAATYGDGSRGYSDEHSGMEMLEPLNLYGKSKLEVDIWARDNGFLKTAVGLRYFNVFGPNEYHKESMRSVVAKKYEDIRTTGSTDLFTSYLPEYEPGEQKRDFIYIKDAVDMTLFFLDHKEVAGIFNIGTGTAHSWNELAISMFSAFGKEPSIHYIDMPEGLRKHYQYFTEADISKLQQCGWEKETYSLQDSVADYVQNYLVPHRHLS